MGYVFVIIGAIGFFVLSLLLLKLWHHLSVQRRVRLLQSQGWARRRQEDAEGYQIAHEQVVEQIELEGFRVQKLRVLRGDYGYQPTRALAKLEQVRAVLRLAPAQAPAWAAGPWQIFPRSRSAPQRLAKRLLAQAKPAEGGGFELALSEEAPEPEALRQALFALVIGAAALSLDEAALAQWLAAAEDRAGQPRPTAHREQLALQLLMEFSASPLAQGVAQWAREAESPLLRQYAQLRLSETADTAQLIERTDLPFAVRVEALQIYLTDLLDQGSPEAIYAYILDPERLSQYTKPICQLFLMKKYSHLHKPEVLQPLFVQVYQHSDLALRIYRLLDQLGAFERTSLEAFTSTSAAMRRENAQKLAQLEGEARPAQVALQWLEALPKLEMHKGQMARGQRYLIQMIGEVGQYEHLLALEAWLQRRVRGGLSPSKKQAAVAWARATIRKRLPQHLAGMLALAGDTEGGQLSLAAQGAELSVSEDDEEAEASDEMEEVNEGEETDEAKDTSE